ncbi:transthyretin-like family domain-containing protein [Ditylenchus destructor]|nr:transthyretin-like family domain-containing protein [Ditylenchus destructor]
MQLLSLIFLTLFAILSIFPAQNLAFRQQSVGIRGRLMCGDKPLSGAKVKLWNKNRLGRDDQLADSKTDAMGNFNLDGGIGSIFGMNVRFKIYHDCDRGVLPCQRKVNLGIPSVYVTRSSTVTKWFDAGVLNMQFKFPDEATSCIN